MRAVHLRRIDAARNMARFYALDVQPTLFGEWSLVREWGRIGQSGQQRIAVYETEGEATAALQRQRQIKERRGYQ